VGHQHFVCSRLDHLQSRRYECTLAKPCTRSSIFRLASGDDDAVTQVATSSATDAAPPLSPPPPLPPGPSAFLQGNAYLLVVAVLWGSYTPTLRTLFTLPGGPSPLIVTAARGFLQAALLGAAVALTSPSPSDAGQEAAPGSEGQSSAGLSPLLQGSLEIGLYNTLGTLLQTWGLSVRRRPCSSRLGTFFLPGPPWRRALFAKLAISPCAFLSCR
jgi:hypothetical protein